MLPSIHLLFKQVAPTRAWRGVVLSAAAFLTCVAVRADESNSDPARAQARGSAERPGEWLLNHARTLGLSTPQPRVDDAEHVLIWLEAAARVQPGLAEAYLWQYDLLNRLARPEAALDALGSYCRLNPADISAQLDLIDRQFERQQSLDARLAFCAEALKAGTLEPVVQSDLHRRMAELYLRSGETTQAEAHAAEAVQAFSGNVSAHELLVDLADPPRRPVRQVHRLLAAIAASPGRADEMWRLARVLEGLSLHKEAASWYERVLQTLEHQAPNASVPVELLVDFASCYADDGQYERAEEMAERAVSFAPEALEAHFLLVDLARRMGHAETVNAHLDTLRKRFSELDTPRPTSAASAPSGQNEAERMYHATWYYLRYEPNPERAVRCASRVRELAPQSTAMQVVYGLAKLAAGEADEAVAVLQPFADTDQWAAAGSGEALFAQGHVEAAVKTLRAGEALRCSGRAYERITAALAAQGQEPAPLPLHAAVHEALRAFDDRVFSFVSRPVEALRFEVTPFQAGWTYGDPWRCEWRLANVASFPISIGEGRMVAGRVLVSLRRTDHPEQELLNYLPASLALRPVLAPGESITLVQTLDVGPAATWARRSPQQPLNLTFSFLLDPIMDQAGRWGSALRDFPPVNVAVGRPGVDASRAGLDRLMALLREGAETDRIKAIRTLAALVAEREAARLTPPDYSLRRVDEIKLRRVVLTTLLDPAPEVRAATLDALRELELGPRLVEQVAPLLSDPNWLVRLITLDVLTDQQGQAFRPVLESFSSSDPDGLVRRLATLRLRQLPPAIGP